MMTPKTVSYSCTTVTQLVMPNDTNTMHNLMGGNLLKWMDVASAICASKHANKPSVTVSVDNVSFSRPIKIGDVVTINAKITRSFVTSMEIYIEVFKENFTIGSDRIRCNEAYFTFVALADDGHPIAVPEVIAETEEEKFRYERALRRRELRLILSGRMKANEATELKSIFFED
ncbi:MAG: acyl-CoA thioesterase [Chitinophagales bacterium]